MLAARAKGKDTIAAAAGVTITGVVSIDETSEPPSRTRSSYASEAADAARGAIPVLAGTDRLSVSVTIVYQIP